MNAARKFGFGATVLLGVMVGIYAYFFAPALVFLMAIAFVPCYVRVSKPGQFA